MKGLNIPPETGVITINGCKMTWTMRRSKTESAFGIRGSRIFELELKRDGVVSGKYNKGWEKQIADEDDPSILCLSYLVSRYGKDIKKKKKEMGSHD